ncbi:MAG TPA: hypothetical protein DD383_00445 [Rikenellaceae bacterium]|nr:hypothetical protein [Rikenellaceae bacterium]
MKKILSFAAVAAATIIAVSSCSKAQTDFAGSDGNVTYSIGPYMMCIADNLIVDNLKILECRIGGGKLDIQSKTSVEDPLDPSYRMPGVKVEKAAEDSTWIISNKNMDYWFLGDDSYPTDYTITARMLPGDYNHFHSWKVSINGERREQKGYSCKFTTPETPLIYTIGDTGYSWSSCQGQLNMIVYRDGKAIDSIAMILRGSRDDYSLARTY